MRAMILAAGLGTRLRPLTFARPKVLVPVMGGTVLDFWIRRLHEAGFQGVVLNAHHLADRLIKFVETTAWPIPVEVRSEPILLGTGGGIRNVLDFFQKEPFLVINGDIISNVSLKGIYHRHLESRCAVSLLMHDCAEFNNVAVDPHGNILGFGREVEGLAQSRRDVRLLAFTGIHVIDPIVLRELPPAIPYDILTTYRQLIREGSPPQALSEADLYWREMGALSAYKELNMELCHTPNLALPPISTGKQIVVHERARLGPHVHLKGMIVIGENTQVMDGAELENTILWDGVRIEEGARLRNCVVADGVKVSGRHDDEAIVEDCS